MFTKQEKEAMGRILEKEVFNLTADDILAELNENPHKLEIGMKIQNNEGRIGKINSFFKKPCDYGERIIIMFDSQMTDIGNTMSLARISRQLDNKLAKIL